MKTFPRALQEINRTINFIYLFRILINSAIFFLVVYFALSLINLYPVLAIIPAGIFLAIRLADAFKTDKRRVVEKTYNPLHEKLRTAADNVRQENNPVVDELQEEVIHDLKGVRLSAFINTRAISFKIFLIILLSFAIVFSTTFNFYIVDFNEFLTTLPDRIDNIRNPNQFSNSPLTGINESDEIYGDSKLAVLGEKEVDIKINQVQFEVSVREEGDYEEKQFDEIFPDEISVEQSTAFEERIPEEQQELVKNYFNELAKG